MAEMAEKFFEYDEWLAEDEKAAAAAETSKTEPRWPTKESFDKLQKAGADSPAKIPDNNDDDDIDECDCGACQERARPEQRAAFKG